VESIIRNSPKELFDLYVVDNGSGDPAIRNYLKDKEVKHEIVGPCIGYGGAINRGIDYYVKNKYEHFIFTNNDMVYSPNWLTTLLDNHKKFPKCEILSPLLLGSQRPKLGKKGVSQEVQNTVNKLIEPIFAKITGTSRTSNDSKEVLLKKFNSIYNNNFEKVCENITTKLKDVRYPHESFGCVMLTKSALEKIGYVDEFFYPLFNEDSNLETQYNTNGETQ